MTSNLSYSQPMKSRRPRRLRKEHRRGELRAVIDETIGLFHRIRWVAEQIYAPAGRSTARRGLLRGLVRFGPQTVPQLAKARSVSRQHIQAVADALAAEGLVERIPNPRHARSLLYRATGKGAALVRSMDEVDDRVLAAAGEHLSRADLAVTARTLAGLRAGFELSGKWRRVLSGALPDP